MYFHFSLGNNKRVEPLQSLNAQYLGSKTCQQPLHNPCTTLAQGAWRRWRNMLLSAFGDSEDSRRPRGRPLSRSRGTTSRRGLPLFPEALAEECPRATPAFTSLTSSALWCETCAASMPVRMLTQLDGSEVYLCHTCDSEVGQKHSTAPISQHGPQASHGVPVAEHITALALLQQLHALGVMLIPYPDGTLRYKRTMTPDLVDQIQ